MFPQYFVPPKPRASSPSFPFLCILLVFPLCAGFLCPDLCVLLFLPQLHLSGWKRSEANSSTVSPPCLSSGKADGKCHISPSHRPLPLLLLFSCIAQGKMLNEKDFGRERRRANSRYFPVCIFYCLPAPVSRHSAFEAGYSWESVERFILERVWVDWHLISLFKCDCYPYAGDHMWLTTPALCASSVFLPNLQFTFWWPTSPWKEVEIVFPFTLKA